jgi:hypothetical protein
LTFEAIRHFIANRAALPFEVWHCHAYFTRMLRIGQVIEWKETAQRLLSEPSFIGT